MHKCKCLHWREGRLTFLHAGGRCPGGAGGHRGTALPVLDGAALVVHAVTLETAEQVEEALISQSVHTRPLKAKTSTHEH